jgi:hypothetical protein
MSKKQNLQVSSSGARTISVPDAGREYFGLGRCASYKAAAEGQIPVIRIGHRLRVPVLALEKMLDIKPTAPSDD